MKQGFFNTVLGPRLRDLLWSSEKKGAEGALPSRGLANGIRLCSVKQNGLARGCGNFVHRPELLQSASFSVVADSKVSSSLRFRRDAA